MIPQITMDPSAAREKFREYRSLVKDRHQAEDEALLRGYRALSAGKSLIALSDVLSRAGLDHEHRPRMAVARADRGRVWTRFAQSSASGYTHTLLQQSTLPPRWSGGDPEWSARRDRSVLHFDGLFPPCPEGKRKRWEALVPPIPPALRPNAKLHNFHMLWEAEWFNGRPSAPVDPYLIRHLHGDLWVVLAKWDLTALERAVILERKADDL
jgi:hypothetical protein